MLKIKVKDVYPADNLNLIVVFENGEIKQYDVKQLFDQFDWYKELENPDIFNLVHVDCGGCGVSWNEDIDVSECELYDNSVAYSTKFSGLYSFADAAQKWGIDDSTLRKAAANGRLIPDIDIKKFGKQWVITDSAMEKCFGKIAHT